MSPARCLPSRASSPRLTARRPSEPPATKNLSRSMLTGTIRLPSRTEKMTCRALSSRRVHVPYGIRNLTNVNNCHNGPLHASMEKSGRATLIFSAIFHVKCFVQPTDRMHRFRQTLAMLVFRFICVNCESVLSAHPPSDCQGTSAGRRWSAVNY